MSQHPAWSAFFSHFFSFNSEWRKRESVRGPIFGFTAKEVFLCQENRNRNHKRRQFLHECIYGTLIKKQRDSAVIPISELLQKKWTRPYFRMSTVPLGRSLSLINGWEVWRKELFCREFSRYIQSPLTYRYTLCRLHEYPRARSELLATPVFMFLPRNFSERREVALKHEDFEYANANWRWVFTSMLLLHGCQVKFWIFLQYEHGRILSKFRREYQANLKSWLVFASVTLFRPGADFSSPNHYVLSLNHFCGEPRKAWK